MKQVTVVVQNTKTKTKYQNNICLSLCSSIFNIHGKKKKTSNEVLTKTLYNETIRATQHKQSDKNLGIKGLLMRRW